jgi:RimJ/RimL family protein N-acetyltransferase
MLHGDILELRLVREGNLSALFELMTDLAARGSYFPLGVTSEPAFRAEFDKNGFWDVDEGMLLMTAGDEIVGEIEYFPITHYLQGYELSYQLFGDRHAGRGYTTEAVKLLVGYLFGRKRVNRMQLNIHPDNAASRRVAEKCGFTFEGLMRGCWFHRATTTISRSGRSFATKSSTAESYGVRAGRLPDFLPTPTSRHSRTSPSCALRGDELLLRVLLAITSSTCTRIRSATAPSTAPVSSTPTPDPRSRTIRV